MSVIESEADRLLFDMSIEDALDSAETEEARFHLRQAAQHEIAARGEELK